jgi:hypothetical protein
MGIMMVTKIHPVLNAIGIYESHHAGDGLSLFRELPNISHANVERYFGDCFADQRDQKYSQAHIFHVLDVVISLYMADGVWRYGVQDPAKGNRCHVLASLNVLERLLEYPIR